MSNTVDDIRTVTVVDTGPRYSRIGAMALIAASMGLGLPFMGIDRHERQRDIPPPQPRYRAPERKPPKLARPNKAYRLKGIRP